MTKRPLLTGGALGVAGLVAAGLLAWPTTATASVQLDDDQFVKRNEDTPELALVDDDDDDDDTGRDRVAERLVLKDGKAVARKSADTDTNTRAQTRTRGTRTFDSRPSRTGGRSGVDDSRDRQVRDWTFDGGDRTIDWSRHDTDDRSRNNTRGR
ncbi:hypothetical protein [Nocardioides sp. R-C-SC26]|uniref:hypothetical protein n=1 Tax=Nocardioides sp. R-C-SC26 TaxID=2870414 RepID=UPI001E452CD2|nr:hypothetical protein [Nocardioides sp. R-C-SC26]